MEVVYVLHHTHVLADGEEDIKLIGVFSTAESAQSAVDELRFQKGFRVDRAGFSVNKYLVDKVHWREGFRSV